MLVVWCRRPDFWFWIVYGPDFLAAADGMLLVMRDDWMMLRCYHSKDGLLQQYGIAHCLLMHCMLLGCEQSSVQDLMLMCSKMKKRWHPSA